MVQCAQLGSDHAACNVRLLDFFRVFLDDGVEGEAVYHLFADLSEEN